MNKKLVFFFVIISFLGESQTTGYMGKKTVIGYGFWFNPAFTAALIGYGDSPVNIQHDFFLERAVAKNIALGFSIKGYKSSYNNTSKMDLYGIPLSTTNSYAYRYKNPTGNYKIKARGYSFYAKFFKKNYVAPWGKYFLVGLAHNIYNCTYDPDQMYLEFINNNYLYFYTKTRFNNFGPTKQLYRYTDIMIGNGNSRIFANNLVIDYGYNLNVVAVVLTPIDAADDDGTATHLDYIKVTSTSRVRGINRFNFYLKVAYLF